MNNQAFIVAGVLTLALSACAGMGTDTADHGMGDSAGSSGSGGAVRAGTSSGPATDARYDTGARGGAANSDAGPLGAPNEGASRSERR